MSYQNGMAGGSYYPQQGGMQSFNNFGGGFNNGGYGGRGRGRRDDGRRGGFRGRGGARDGDRPPAFTENTSARMRKMVIKFAEEEDFHPVEDPPRLARVLRRSWKEAGPGVCDGFRVGITQEPHKHAHYVSLLLQLSRRPIPNPEEEVDTDAQTGEKRKAEEFRPETVECGREILQDLSRGFTTWVEGREWLNMRLCLQFFSLLVPAGLVSARSLLEVYRALLTVLNEVGGGGDRADRAVRAVGEGLMRSAATLVQTSPDDVETLMSSLESAIAIHQPSQLVDPLSPILPDGEMKDSLPSVLSQLQSALRELREGEYTAPACLPSYWQDAPLPEGALQSDPFELASATMPPELYEAVEETTEAGEGKTGSLVLFAEDIVASSSTLQGWVLRSLALDLTHIFEVNRKECARILLSLRDFLTPGTFKPLNASKEDDKPASTLSLESLVVNTLLATMLTMPASPSPLIHYGSVITELCKLSPNTVAPPVGRAVRKLFSLMGSEGLDVEISSRVAEWFAVHLSNFGFQWMWKEWIPDLELAHAHPRRAFMRRVVDLEVRLAYHERISDSLPEVMKEESAGVISAEAPDPYWPYEKDDHPLHTEATDLLKACRGKATSDEVKKYLTELPQSSSSASSRLDPSIIQMACETILHLGSRSFSHFLNATERYLDLLRYLTPDPSSRVILLEAVASYWRYSSQMRLITVDKYLQYGILEGLDIITWVFSEGAGGGGGDEGDGWTDVEKWEVLRMMLDKLVGRVVGVRRRVRAVEKEDEAARARRAAENLDSGEGLGMDEDNEDDTRLDGSKEARDAQTSLDIQVTRLEKVLSATMKEFASALIPWKYGGDGSAQGLKAVLTLLDSGVEGYWSVRAKFGWFREFVRRYEAHLRPLDGIIRASVLDGLSGSEEGSVEARAERMVKDVLAGFKLSDH